MTDSLRSDRSSTTGDAADRERDARIEDLLLVGLNHYFAGQHELAISVWTRVLFLDRGHAVARAYIERARGAVAERQREGDELFHTGAAALNQGDRTTARELLTSAVDRGASGEEALALLYRLERLEAAGREVPGPTPAQHPSVERGGADAAGRRDARLAWVAAGIFAGILIAAVAAGYLLIVSDPFDLGAARTSVPPAAEEPLTVPAPCEIRLIRARNLAAKGHLHEALGMLEAGDPDDRHRAGFDGLRATIQRRLLTEGREAASRPSGAAQSR